MNMILSIAAGGAMGAVARHYAGVMALTLWGAAFPWGTLIVNVVGSAIMGLLIGLFAHAGQPSAALRAFLTVGVLGGFTTFSTFSLDTVTLWERGDVGAAFFYAAGSVVLSLAALAAALYTTRMVLS